MPTWSPARRRSQAAVGVGRVGGSRRRARVRAGEAEGVPAEDATGKRDETSRVGASAARERSRRTVAARGSHSSLNFGFGRNRKFQCQMERRSPIVTGLAAGVAGHPIPASPSSANENLPGAYPAWFLSGSTARRHSRHTHHAEEPCHPGRAALARKVEGSGPRRRAALDKGFRRLERWARDPPRVCNRIPCSFTQGSFC